MFRTIRNLFAAPTHRPTRSRPSRPQTARLGLERMEERDCPTAIPLNSPLAYDLGRLLNDAYRVETTRPTLMSQYMVQDLYKIYNDVLYGSPQKLGYDLNVFGQHLNHEAYWSQYYGQTPLLSYISTDVQAVVRDLQTGQGGASTGGQAPITANSPIFMGIVGQLNGGYVPGQ